MQLIDGTYFIGELNIPNLDTEPVRQSLTVFIAKYQKRFLQLLLGEDVYEAFKAGMDVEGDEIEAQWTELRNKLVDCETKESPIANYVYYFYMRNNATQTTGVGETRPSAENSTPMSGAQKMVRAWNEMCDFVHGTKEWFHDYYATWNFAHDGYFFNMYCYNSYKSEFEKQNILNL